MRKIISRLPLRAAIYGAIIPPLTAMALLGGVKVWESYQGYRNAQTVWLVQRFANASGELAESLPAEMFATSDGMAAARSRTDSAFAGISDAYDGLKQVEMVDPIFEADFRFVQDNKARWYAFRDHVKSNHDQLNGALMAEGISLVPLPTAAIDIVRRAGSHATDAHIAGLLQGYYALMQINEASTMEMANGAVYLSNTELSAQQKTLVINSKVNFANFQNTLIEQLPTTIIGAYRDFLESDDQTFIAGVRTGLYGLEASGQADAEKLERWNSATSKRLLILGKAFSDTRAYLEEASLNDVATARFNLLMFSIATVGLFVLIAAASVALSTSVAGSLKRIIERMTGLAGGNVDTAVPGMERTDEIGQMARAVEHFRQNAIERQNLERETEVMRSRSEAERAELRARADRETADKLATATQGLAGAMQALAMGDLCCEVKDRFSEEFEGLRQDFNTSVVQLRNALAGVGRLAAAVDQESTSFSSGSADLSHRTSEQAAALEETAAALHQITSNVGATTQRTGLARDAVRDATKRAEGAASVVRSAIKAMQKIEESSGRINQIIGVIDEIAFQTNLLALNAGVEAARAGDAGRGFAVVAQEVRELAQRSAKAAKEIKGLINNSAVAVGDGVALVSETGVGLSEIEGLVREIRAHMDAIAGAAEEQSVGLAQINSTVAQFDKATQKNGAMVEDMASGGARLADSSAELQSMLSRFRLGITPDAPSGSITRFGRARAA
ncbi:methyl-accepting chemotaxis protein [Rhizobium hainanense]|uniref:Methyl-accepting chemotaxis protein n=1 Tax=Rhizobium hainanense TaxID=52131 RepID=A0A1C3WKT1_9HYPH|nr:methyl-accepting chemotaxis protein [Rhizobium hainanense]SCB40334.1 methyl-accepting chemotaxis protein [Rhizobium hainanense]